MRIDCYTAVLFRKGAKPNSGESPKLKDPHTLHNNFSLDNRYPQAESDNTGYMARTDATAM
jgi:hypothetical protein